MKCNNNFGVIQVLKQSFLFLKQEFRELMRISFLWFFVSTASLVLSGNQSIFKQSDSTNWLILFLVICQLVTSVAFSVQWLQFVLSKKRKENILEINFGDKELRYLGYSLCLTFIMVVSFGAFYYLVTSINRFVPEGLNSAFTICSTIGLCIGLFYAYIRLSLFSIGIAKDLHNPINFSLKRTEGAILKIGAAYILLILIVSLIAGSIIFLGGILGETSNKFLLAIVQVMFGSLGLTLAANIVLMQEKQS
ncbi:MAG: hypothetical protein K0S74_77 [Chlamydiales bacterium]|jgi:hypothetical protein|nr:hypothetical protein [Chlamydiales bacterium]